MAKFVRILLDDTYKNVDKMQTAVKKQYILKRFFFLDFFILYYMKII